MNLYKIGDLALKANVSTRTIDYYTSIGLIQPEQRSTGNYRLYSEDCITLLKMIERLKEEKYTLQEIKQKLSVSRNTSQVEVLSKVESIQENMKKVERDLKELEPYLREIKGNKELKKAFQEMTAKGMSMTQVILTILNETMFML